MATYVILPEGGDAIGLPGFIAGILGAIFGGYYYATHGGDVAEAAAATGGTTFALFAILGEKIANIAPQSEVLYLIGWFVHWILGIGFAICSGVGAFIQSGKERRDQK